MAEHYIVREEIKSNKIPECPVHKVHTDDVIAFVDTTGLIHFSDWDPINERWYFRPLLSRWIGQKRYYSNWPIENSAIDALKAGLEVHRFTSPKAFFKWAAEVS